MRGQVGVALGAYIDLLLVQVRLENPTHRVWRGEGHCDRPGGRRLDQRREARSAGATGRRASAWRRVDAPSTATPSWEKDRWTRKERGRQVVSLRRPAGARSEQDTVAIAAAAAWTGKTSE